MSLHLSSFRGKESEFIKELLLQNPANKHLFDDELLLDGISTIILSYYEQSNPSLREREMLESFYLLIRHPAYQKHLPDLIRKLQNMPNIPPWANPFIEHILVYSEEIYSKIREYRYINCISDELLFTIGVEGSDIKSSSIFRFILDYLRSKNVLLSCIKKSLDHYLSQDNLKHYVSSLCKIYSLPEITVDTKHIKYLMERYPVDYVYFFEAIVQSRKLRCDRRFFEDYLTKSSAGCFEGYLTKSPIGCCRDVLSIEEIINSQNLPLKNRPSKDLLELSTVVDIIWRCIYKINLVQKECYSLLNYFAYRIKHPISEGDLIQFRYYITETTIEKLFTLSWFTRRTHPNISKKYFLIRYLMVRKLDILPEIREKITTYLLLL